MRAVLLMALVAALGVLAGCGGDGGSTAPGSASGPAVAWVDPDGDPPYIGSLSVDPAGGSLLMATNTGLFRIPAKGGPPEKVTGQLTTPHGSGKVSEALVVRYTGPGELVGSGHPSAGGGSTLPAALGLIRSHDAGRTWESVSQLGTSDFHALSVTGDEIVAPLYGQSQILLSRDGGRNFEARVAPMALVDLAVDPGDTKHWVATSEQGIYVSGDEGKTWRQRDPTPNVRLTWAEPGALYRIDPGGPVKVSADGGGTWEDRGDTGGEPQALTAGSDGALYAATLDGKVQRSADGGKTWSALVTP
jgi:photosystem II stability/assembly factor-like uncharacterized protein